MHAEPPYSTIRERLREVIELHFDPRDGAPFWLERAKQWGFDPRETVRTIDDLPRLGWIEPRTLHDRPVEDFLPRPVRAERSSLVLAQTGGTMGRPVWTAYTREEFEAAFVEPFIVAAKHVGFPGGGCWLYVGPSGPHIIARAAEALARRWGAWPPFCVDFDARWVKKLPAGSFAARRYLHHLVEQAMSIVERESINVVFTTPPVLRALADAMRPPQRERIRGVHYGGLRLDPAELARFQEEDFPQAVHVAGYGNTLFGCCMELSPAPGRTPTYFPQGDRLIFGVCFDERANEGGEVGTSSDVAEQCFPHRMQSDSGDIARAEARGSEKKKRTRASRKGAVADSGRAAGTSREEVVSFRYEHPGDRGRLVFSRLDRTVLLLNVRERDEVRLASPPTDAPDGFHRCGVIDPHPTPEAGPPPGTSVYY